MGKKISIEQSLALNLVKNLRNLNFTYKEITMQTGISSSSIYRYTKKGKIPSLKTSRNVIKVTENIDVKSNFYSEASKEEKKRLKRKQFIREGVYNTSSGVNERNALKIVKRVSISSPENLYRTIKKIMGTYFKTWKKRNDYLFYLGVYGHLLDGVEGYRSMIIQSVICNGNLTDAMFTAYQDFYEKFEDFLEQDYAEFWLVTEMWFTGQHFVLNSFDNEKPKILKGNKDKRLEKRKRIQTKLDN